MRNKKILLLLCISLLLSVSSCGTKIAEKKTIAIITKSTESNFWKDVYAGASTAAIEYNVNIVFEGPKNEEDWETQNEMIEAAIRNGVVAIVFSAINYDKSVDIVEKAINDGIYVVIIDSNINSTMPQMHIGTNNYLAGVMAGKEALRGSEETINIGIVNFDVHSANGQEREKGFTDTVVLDSRVNICEVINVDSNIKDASDGTKDLLARHPEINMIVTLNEWTTLGVGYAVSELGCKDKVRVIGFDNNIISIGMLETGEMDALIVQNPFAMGYLGVESSKTLIEKNELDSSDINTETICVTTENMFDEASQKLLFPFK